MRLPIPSILGRQVAQRQQRQAMVEETEYQAGRAADKDANARFKTVHKNMTRAMSNPSIDFPPNFNPKEYANQMADDSLVEREAHYIGTAADLADKKAYKLERDRKLPRGSSARPSRSEVKSARKDAKALGKAAKAANERENYHMHETYGGK